ncbi:MAG: hypothetical protein GY822_16815 [Deltaproteobacteria bacterium]|nr:hypothetical protein [Deltaproteobacteria bacterium]
MSLLRRLASLGCVGTFAFFSLATSKAPPTKVPPTLQMSTDVPDPAFLAQHRTRRGRDCDASVVVERGAVPENAHALVKLRLAGDKAVPYSFYAAALKERAQKYCADGLSILSAEPSSKSSGFDAVNAMVWVRKTTSEAKATDDSSTQKTPPAKKRILPNTPNATSAHDAADAGIAAPLMHDGGIAAPEAVKEKPDAF